MAEERKLRGKFPKGGAVLELGWVVFPRVGWDTGSDVQPWSSWAGVDRSWARSSLLWRVGEMRVERRMPGLVAVSFGQHHGSGSLPLLTCRCAG
jgi:hypothetical protein